MKNGYFHISLLLDRSGSMQSIWEPTILGVNSYVDSQRHQRDCRFSLAQFDDVYELLYDAVPIHSVAPRTRENYVPRGMTALHDSMARLIDSTGARFAAMPEHERPERVLFVTQTDGLENASRHFTMDQVRQKIEHQRNVYHWEFVFLGANQDSILTARNLGMSAAATMTYAANHVGTVAAVDALIRNTNSYGATGQSVRFEPHERLFQASVGAHADELNAANDPNAFDPLAKEDAAKSA